MCRAHHVAETPRWRRQAVSSASQTILRPAVSTTPLPLLSSISSQRANRRRSGSSVISGCLSSSYPAFPHPVRHMLCRPVRGSVSIRRWMLCGGPVLQAPPPTTASTFSSYPRCVFGTFLDSNSLWAMCISLCIGVLHRSPPPLIEMTS